MANMGVDHRSPHIGVTQDPLTPTLSRQGRGNLRVAPHPHPPPRWGEGIEPKTRRAGARMDTCPRYTGKTYETFIGPCSLLLALEAPLVVDHVPGLFLRDRGPDQRHHAGPRTPVLDHPEHLAIGPVLVELRIREV